MSLITDAGLAIINSALALLTLALVLSLAWSLRRYMPFLGRRAEDSPVNPRLHAIAGSLALILSAVLSGASSLGPLTRAIGVPEVGLIIQIITLTLRLSIFIVMLAWVAVTVQDGIVKRWPMLGDRIDRWLRVG